MRISRRLPALALVAVLVAFGCDLGPLCATAQVTQGGCCCPDMEGMDGMATDPCLDTDGSGTPAPEREADVGLDLQAPMPAAATSAVGPDRTPDGVAVAGLGERSRTPSTPLFLAHCALLN